VPPSRSLCRHGGIGRWNGVGTALKRANGPQVGLTIISSLPPRRDTLPHDASGPVHQEGCTRPGRSGSGSSASPCWTARLGPITRPRRGTRALQCSSAMLPAVASRPATGAYDAHGRTVIPPRPPCPTHIRRDGDTAQASPVLSECTDQPALRIIAAQDQNPLWTIRTAVRVHVEVAVSDRLATIVIGRPPACPSGGWGRQTELLADAGYRAAPAM
jgi:hypothetical protein